MLALNDKHRLSMVYQTQCKHGNAWLALTFKALTAHWRTSLFIMNLPNCWKYAVFWKYLHLQICLEKLPIRLTLVVMNRDKIFLMVICGYSLFSQGGFNWLWSFIRQINVCWIFWNINFPGIFTTFGCLWHMWDAETAAYVFTIFIGHFNSCNHIYYVIQYPDLWMMVKN